LYAETSAAFEAASAGSSKNVAEADPPALETHTSVDSGHGRIETRVTEGIDDFEDWVPATSQWWHVKTPPRTWRPYDSLRST
jgi:hypothetical protein